MNYYGSQIPELLSLKEEEIPEDFDIRTAYFSKHDWDSVFSNSTRQEHDGLKRTESDEKTWRKWLLTFQNYPISKSFIFQLFDEKEISGFIYIIRDEFANRFKIGWTSDSNIEKRKSELQTGSSQVLSIVDSFPAASRKTERTLHVRFKEKRLQGEWFALSEDDVTNICSPQWRKLHYIF